jgi:hypothetical protein
MSPDPTRRPVPSGRAHHVESAQHRWLPVVAAPLRLPPPPPLALLRMSPRKLPPTPLLPSTVQQHASLLCSKQATASPPPPATDEPPLSCLTGPMEVPHHHAPSCTKNLPAAPASEAEQRDSPTVVFLCEHLTGDSHLRLFPHPADPVANSAPPSNSSLTTSSPALTTPSAPHWHPLPVGTHAAEVPPLVSTPFPASASRFSCSCV